MVDPITMMVASIGMQFFNNYANSKKNSEIQKKQREFQKAAAEHDFERMRKLQAESAKLALELEAEVHKERVEDINSNYDALLENFAHSFAIQNWPLNVLPFIMKHFVKPIAVRRCKDAMHIYRFCSSIEQTTK